MQFDLVVLFDQVSEIFCGSPAHKTARFERTLAFRLIPRLRLVRIFFSTGI